jgi:hypothetical protein
MLKRFFLMLLLSLPTFAFSDNYILFITYDIIINSKYKYQTVIKYDYENLKDGVVKSEVMTKPLKGTPPYLHIYSSQTSSFDRSGNLQSSHIKFSHGDLEKEFSFTNEVNQKVYDLSSFVWVFSKNSLGNSMYLLYGEILTNVSFTNSPNGYIYGNNIIKVKRISELSVIDRFILKEVNIGKFTNAAAEGKLVDIRLINF